MTNTSTYTLTLSNGELTRYRFMAAHARREEREAWRTAGIVSGARVADVGCGPAMMLLELADAVGPTGSVVGVERDAQARMIAHQVIASAGLANARVVAGDACATGLDPGRYDTVMVRHVLLHNGTTAAEIVGHAVSLLRPGGSLYLVETDASAVRQIPRDDDLDDQLARFCALLRKHGNDVTIGTRLGQLVLDAGLQLVDRAGRYEALACDEHGGRGVGSQARPAMLEAGLATREDFARWDAAYARYAAAPGDKVLFAPIFRAIGRRPSVN